MADADAKEAAPRKKTIGSRLVSHMIHEEFHTWDFKTRADFIKTEVLLGITICFAQIPESVAFAFMAHIKPPVALHAAWVVGLICTVFGGRSGMVNGAEGAFAAIISTLVDLPEEKGGNGEGVELLFPSVMTAGAICFVVWAIGGHRYITLIAASVMDGFCCGLAVVIGMSQLHPFEIGHGVWKEGVELAFMIIIMLTAMLVMEFVPKIPHKAAKLLPSSLLAILSAVLIEYAIARNVPCPQTCAEHWAAHEIDMGGGHRRLDGGPSPSGFVAHVGRQLASAAAQLSEELHEHWVHDHEHKGGVLPDATSHNHSHTIGTECSAELEAQLAGMMCRTDVIGDVTPFTLTYPYPFFINSDFTNYNMSKLTDDPGAPAAILLQGLLLAIAGMIQGLMTVEVVTSYIKTPSDNSAVIASMGLANLVSGFLGGMGGDAMIGLSTINCLNGGKSRLGPTIVALGIAFFVMGVPVVLNFVPIASLSGVMIVVVLHTFKWAKIPMVLAFFVPQKFRKTINTGLCGCLPKWMHLPEEVDRWEVIIILAVTLITIFVNLVIAVG